jgi:hypothetical protein
MKPMSISNINSITTAFQPIVERVIQRQQTANAETADATQNRGLSNLKGILGPSTVDLFADAGITTPTPLGSRVDLQI